jgi:hypothetical protein
LRLAAAGNYHYQVDDLERHAGQPTITASRPQMTAPISHAIEYSSGTG